MNKTRALLDKIEHAKRELVAAETDITRLLSEIIQAPRAEKKAVSEVMESAFSRLRSAKGELAELEAMIVSDEG